MGFVVYCLEEYRNAKKLTGRQVIAVFNKYRIYDFIENSYEVLHTYSGDEIAWNISEYIKHKVSTSMESLKSPIELHDGR